MRQVDVIYTEASVTKVRGLLRTVSRWIRVETDPKSKMTIVFIDKDVPWYHKNGTVLILKALELLQVNDHEPILSNVSVFPRREVVINPTTGELRFQYEQKHHFEHITKRFRIGFNVTGMMAWDSIGVTDVYLMGPHTAVRKAKRWLANRLSNKQTTLGVNDLENLRKQLSAKVGMYFLTDMNTVIDIRNCKIGSQCFPNDVTQNVLDNTHTVLTGHFVRHVTPTHTWNSLLTLSSIGGILK